MNKFEGLIQGKKVLVFGLGRQGGGTGDRDYLIRHGAIVRVSDTDLSLAPEGQTKEQINWADMIIKNPGVSDGHELIVYAHTLKKPVLTSIAVFVKYAGITTIGVTGTRGKSTTVALIKAVLEESFPGQIIAGGNIPGTSGLSLLDQLGGKKYAVLELSSFQLHNFHDLQVSPNISIITNLYPDHLNRYKTMGDYAYDKQAICQYQGEENFCLYNQNNPGSVQIMTVGSGKKIAYSATDYFIWDTKLPGLHNKENISACATLAQVLKIDNNLVKRVIADFTGLKYRLETIRIVNGVTYINDTTSTTPVAAIKALQSLTSPTIWITGGDTKNIPHDDLLTEVESNKYLVKVIILGSKNIPDYVDSLKQILGQKVIAQVFSMDEAVTLASESSDDGYNVLLSPGFSSFDLFKNEFARGDQFSELVHKL